MSLLREFLQSLLQGSPVCLNEWPSSDPKVPTKKLYFSEVLEEMGGNVKKNAVDMVAVRGTIVIAIKYESKEEIV